MRFLVAALILLAFGLLFRSPLTAAAKVFLLASEQFPQIPVKPLGLISSPPRTEKIELGEGENKIVAEVFLPAAAGQHPAIIIALGVRTQEKDRPFVVGFADTLARLGYVVFWPRLETIDLDLIKFERPQTFTTSFQYLEKRAEVDPQRISFMGFSVGSSLAMVAAEDPAINERVRGFVAFGAYFSILDYLRALSTKTILVDGQTAAWQPTEDGLNQVTDVLGKEGLKLEQFSDDLLSPTEKGGILRYSPDQNIANFKTPIFILHEKADGYVPYVESLKLKQALEGKVPLTFHLANLFEHVQPKKGFSFEILGEFAGLFGFIHQAIAFL